MASAGYGLKTIYLKVRNAAGESKVVKDTITLVALQGKWVVTVYPLGKPERWGTITIDSSGDVTSIAGFTYLISQSGHFAASQSGAVTGSCSVQFVSNSYGRVESGTFGVNGDFTGADKIQGSGSYSWSNTGGYSGTEYYSFTMKR
jgi:hypothetical protein